MLRTKLIQHPLTEHRTRVVVGILLGIFSAAAIGYYMVVQSKIIALKQAHDYSTVAGKKIPEPFPISVDPIQKRIEINFAQETYIESYAAEYVAHNTSNQWFDQLISRLSLQSWYQNLATPHSRILIILPGERKEQVAYNFSRILNWEQADRDTFLQLVEDTPPAFTDGTLLPGRYIADRNATPHNVHATIQDRFQNIVLARYPAEYEQIVPLHNALIIASLLEREAYDFTDMRIISGIIWNRLFIDMNLQIDATLQYARSETEPWLTTWWPVPRPIDKFIDSPYNTYQNAGLPPSPISNPHVASIIAALNPKPTDCIFYFHDRQAGFHCSETYEEHVAKLRIHYGQGR